MACTLLARRWVSVRLSDRCTDYAAAPMVAGLAAFRPANFVGVFSSRHAVNGRMPYQPRFKRCCLHAGVVPPRASSLKQRLVYAHHAESHRKQPRCGPIRYKYHARPN
jgi:hypothetical protein